MATWLFGLRAASATVPRLEHAFLAHLMCERRLVRLGLAFSVGHRFRDDPPLTAMVSIA